MFSAKRDDDVTPGITSVGSSISVNMSMFGQSNQNPDHYYLRFKNTLGKDVLEVSHNGVYVRSNTSGGSSFTAAPTDLFTIGGVFQTNPAIIATMTVTSDGKVGIGLRSPSGSFSVSRGQLLNQPIITATSDTVKFQVTGASTAVYNDFYVTGASITVSGGQSGISVTTYTVDGKSLFQSTYTANFCDGCVLYFSSGSIPAATSITVSITGVSTFLIPVCSEYEGVNTAVTSVRLKSIAADRSSFVIYNADAINEKKFVCVVAWK